MAADRGCCSDGKAISVSYVKNGVTKLKLLYLLQNFHQFTDKEHSMTIAELAEALMEHSIPSRRQTLYSDIRLLNSFGFDIIAERRLYASIYYMGSCIFEQPDLQLLVDSIQSFKFITMKKTEELIQKLENLTSQHVAGQLQRQVYVKKRIKTRDESIYYSIDHLSAAISSNLAVRFQYYEYTPGRTRVMRNGGKIYTVSPYSLIWDNETIISSVMITMPVL